MKKGKLRKRVLKNEIPGCEKKIINSTEIWKTAKKVSQNIKTMRWTT